MSCAVVLRVFALIFAMAAVTGGALFISTTFARVRTDPTKYDGALTEAFGDKKKTILSYSVFYYATFRFYPGDVLYTSGHPSYEDDALFPPGKWKRMIRAVQATGVLGLFFAFINMILCFAYLLVGCLGGGSKDNNNEEDNNNNKSGGTTPYGDENSSATGEMSEVEVQDPKNKDNNNNNNDGDDNNDNNNEDKEDSLSEVEVEDPNNNKKNKKNKKGSGSSCTGLAIAILLFCLLSFFLYVGAFVMAVVLIEEPAKDLMEWMEWADYGLALPGPTAIGIEAYDNVKKIYSTGFILMIVAMGASLLLLIFSMMMCCCCKS